MSVSGIISSAGVTSIVSVHHQRCRHCSRPSRRKLAGAEVFVFIADGLAAMRRLGALLLALSSVGSAALACKAGPPPSLFWPSLSTCAQQSETPEPPHTTSRTRVAYHTGRLSFPPGFEILPETGSSLSSICSERGLAGVHTELLASQLQDLLIHTSNHRPNVNVSLIRGYIIQHRTTYEALPISAGTLRTCILADVAHTTVPVVTAYAQN